MSEMIARFPFRFYTSSRLVEITGRKAHHLKEFVRILKEIDLSSVFHHIHNAFREYSFAPGQYSNDFARWAAEDLEESTLAERLSSIYIRDYTDLESLRKRIIEVVEEHLAAAVEIRKAPAGREFYFLRSTAIISPTPYEARTLDEFASALKRVGMRSLYFHFFEARLRLGHQTNDFSNWLSGSLDNPEMAAEIDRLDPYFMSMDQLRDKMIDICLGNTENKMVDFILRLPASIVNDMFTFGKRIYRKIFRWVND